MDYIDTINRKISIIVPVYNAEKYLRDCLDSLLNQNLAYADYEIVCVNDGSKDGSAGILSEYAEKYENIVVIHQENSGVSAARNAGLELARGEYVWFVDSDDCVRKNCLWEIARITEEAQPHLLRFGHERVNDEQMKVAQNAELASYGWKSTKHIHINSVWTSVFRLKEIKKENLSFRTDIKFGEDSLFQAYFFLYRDTDRCISTAESLYFYRQHEASAMHDISPSQMIRHSEDLLRRAIVFRSERKNKAFARDSKFLKRMQYSCVFNFLTLLPATGKDVEEALKELKELRLYPFPCCWFKVRAVKGLKGKIKNAYRAIYFRFSCLYKRYYLRNRRRNCK